MSVCDWVNVPKGWLGGQVLPPVQRKVPYSGVMRNARAPFALVLSIMSMRNWLKLPLESTGTIVVSGEKMSVSHAEVEQSALPSTSASFLHVPPRRRHMLAPHWLPRCVRLLPSMSWTGEDG